MYTKNKRSDYLTFLERSLELNWPYLLFESIFLIGGIALIIAGHKIRIKSKTTSVVSIIAGIMIVLIVLYVMYSTLVFRLNS